MKSPTTLIVHVPAGPVPAVAYRTYETARSMDLVLNELTSEADPERLPVQMQVLHFADAGDDACDFRDVRPIGTSTTDNGAIDLVSAHHDAGGTTEKLWFLRSAGRTGDEIHAGYGHGTSARTCYRIIPVKTTPVHERI